MEQKKELISEKLMRDMKEALKSGDKVRLSAVRMLIAELKNARIAAREDLSLEEEEKVLSAYARKRKEAVEQYTYGGRKDLADKEQREYEITLSYLPKRLDEAELKAIIRQHIEETGATGKKDFGRVMKAVMEAVGSRAEGTTVSMLLREMLDG